METSVLNKILEQHKLFLDGKGGKRANLRGADLRYASLRGAYLSGANLGGADLRDTNLYCANLMGADLMGADLYCANLVGASLVGANLRGAFLEGANLEGAVGLPNVSWIIPGCLVQLNENMHGFYLKKEKKLVNFVQDSLGFFIQDNPIEKTFDMLVEDKIIRGIPDWVKYTGLKPVE